MNFLEICDINAIKKNDDLFTCIINPKNYRDWEKADAFGLFVEGIHQFCVKVIRKKFQQNNKDQKKRNVPVQINNFELHITPKYESYYLQGTIDYISNKISIVNFKVYPSAKSISTNKLCAQGQIYIGSIDLNNGDKNGR